jgi:hypothetical protein
VLYVNTANERKFKEGKPLKDFLYRLEVDWWLCREKRLRMGDRKKIKLLG